MKKTLTILLVALTLVSLTLTFAPHVSAQTENVKVLNYSYTIDYVNNVLYVYGELQNTGATTLTNVTLTGSVYSSDGTDQADHLGQVYVIYIVPGQKVPFEADFNAPKSSSDGTWSSVSISRIDFKINQADPSNSYPYAGVKIAAQSSSIDSTPTNKGTYWVSGTLKNTGTETAQSIWVVATFYDSSGKTVSSGWSQTKVASLAPSGTNSFKIGAFDINMSDPNTQHKISSYSLLVSTINPMETSGTVPAASEYGIVADSSTQPDSSTNPTSNSSTGVNSPTHANYDWVIYAAIIIVVIAAVAITILRFPRRKPTETKTKHKTASTSKSPSKKPQGKLRLNTAPLFKYFMRNWVCL
jgi:hypothetical protein